MLTVFKKLKSFDETASYNSAVLRVLGTFICTCASRRRLRVLNSGFLLTYCFFLPYGIVLKVIKIFTIFDVQATANRDKFL